MPKRKRVVILEDWNGLFADAPSVTRLRQRADVDVQGDSPASQGELVDRLRDAHVVVLNRERTRFDAAVIAALPALELIVQTGSIGPNVDADAARAHGVALAGAPGLPDSINGVAELALGLLLSLARRIPAQDRDVRAGRWQVAPTMMLADGTMGIVGLGRLGGSLARLGQALQMRLLATGPTLTPERAAAAGVTFATMDQVFAQADAVFICARLSDRTRGLVTRAHLERMRPTAFLINVARGPIVDEAALVDLLRAGRIAGAGLDVFDREPLPLDHPLLSLDNVVLTPHIGWVTATNTARFVESAVAAIEQHLGK